MKRAQCFILAFALAVGCAGAPTVDLGMSIGRYQPPAPVPSTAALSGRIIVSGIGADRIVELRDDDADVVRLLGNETVALTGVDDGDVVVWGTWVADPGFVVSSFKVTAMHGRPALDGVLEATDEGFALRSKDGSFQALPGLNSECALYLGARIWVVGHDDGSDVQFGVIAGAKS